MRADLEIIQEWIPAGSRVLDLGCGDGELLTWLRDNKQVTGYGLEIDADNIAECVAKGINVIEQDLDKGLGNFASNSFDIGGHDPGAASRALPGQDPRRNAARRPSVHHHLPEFRSLALPLVPGEQRAGCRFRSSCRTPGTTRRTSTSAPSQTLKRCVANVKRRSLIGLAVDQQHRHGWASKLWPNLLGEIGIYRVSSPGLQTTRSRSEPPHFEENDHGSSSVVSTDQPA